MTYMDFKKLKARVALREILDHYGLLTNVEQTAQGYQGSCPFCSRPTFNTIDASNVWFCTGRCKAEAEEDGTRNGGNTLDFVARREGVSAKKAAELIAEWFPENPSVARKDDIQTEDVTETTESSALPGKPKEVDAKSQQKREGADVGQEGPAPEPQAPNAPTEATAKDISPPSVRGCNNPLHFTLKSITFEHPTLEALGFERETLELFGIGYFTGKGTMHDKVVIPFQNADGSLVAYAGYSPRDGSITYPETFDCRLELFNYLLAENAGLYEERLVLVTDLLNVLRLYELGLHRAAAIPTATLYRPQLALIEQIVGDGGQVDFVPWTKEYVDTLAWLIPRFHVRLHRYYQGSEDEFISQVVNTIGW